MGGPRNGRTPATGTPGTGPVAVSRRRGTRPRAGSSSPSGPVALTGTPGTGKSSVARGLARTWRVVEVGTCALEWGYATHRPGGTVVDLPALRRAFASLHRKDPHDVYVGHLAHLLPIRDVVVLRCHPLELAGRLARGRRGRPREQSENVAAEALDVVLVEARGPQRRLWEVDTTGRPLSGVVRSVARRLRYRGRSSYGRLSWLSDPSVTDYLLERSP